MHSRRLTKRTTCRYVDSLRRPGSTREWLRRARRAHCSIWPAASPWCGRSPSHWVRADAVRPLASTANTGVQPRTVDCADRASCRAAHPAPAPYSAHRPDGRVSRADGQGSDSLRSGGWRAKGCGYGGGKHGAPAAAWQSAPLARIPGARALHVGDTGPVCCAAGSDRASQGRGNRYKLRFAGSERMAWTSWIAFGK